MRCVIEDEDEKSEGKEEKNSLVFFFPNLDSSKEKIGPAKATSLLSLSVLSLFLSPPPFSSFSQLSNSREQRE